MRTTTKILSFSPEQVTVPVGETVRWTNADSTSHTITANDGSFDSGSKAAGGTFERMFTAAGTFTYFCAIHTSMQGTVQVGGAASTTASTTTTSAPATTTTTAQVLTVEDDEGGTPGWVIPGIVALLLAVGAGAWVLRRRRSAGVG
jgi:MYXO-CTERM domain-containing protein